MGQMKVLVVNAGSSSLKYQLFDMENEKVLAKGICERIGIDGAITHKVPGREPYFAEREMKSHTDATKILVETLCSRELGVIESMDEIEAVGHRIVHGGAFLKESVIVNDDVLKKLEECLDIAPLHTAAHLMGINGCAQAMPGKPQVLVIDTAFHSTMPPEAYTYALPKDMCEKYHIRRYGFHGTSHRYVSGEMIKLLDKPVDDTKIITCHLGNGSSISAVKGGRVIDTSMGFTPLDGFVMGSRCGSIDPAIVPFIMEKEGMSPDEMNNFMNKKCGLLGVSNGLSSDCRNLGEAVAAGNADAKLAIDILCYQIKKYVGAYTAAMGGLDALVFTAGIGENRDEIRSAACRDMEYFGIMLDEKKNAKTKLQNDNVCISLPESKVKVYVIPTNEELVIARDTERLVGGKNL